jgi:tetratricopeptide (TPR) repeat protein
MKRLIALLFGITGLAAYGQQSDFFYSKGKEYYDNNQYREALYYLKKFVTLDSTRAEVYKWRGNCYFTLNHPDSALLDYNKALSLTSAMPELYYNISNVYGSLNRHEESERHLRTFLAYDPDDIDGILQLVRILQHKKNDSSLFYLEKAYTLDTLNQYIQNLLGWEYFYRGNSPRALKVAKRSRELFVYTNELLPLEAYAHMGVGDYDNAVKVADSLIRKSPEPMPFYVVKVKAEILSNTPDAVFGHRKHQLKFAELRSDNMSRLDSLVRDSLNRYHYATLVHKYKNNFGQMPLDEIFMAYYGFSSDKNFSPYSPASAELQKLFEEENYEGVIAECIRILENDPFNLRMLESLALAQFNLKKVNDFQGTLKRYVGIMEGIMATGTGTSADSAFIVISPMHEYDLLSYIGGESQAQALTNKDGHAFDILTIKTETGNEEKLYFNIDKPMQSLRIMFDRTEKEKKDRPGRRKKKKS